MSAPEGEAMNRPPIPQGVYGVCEGCGAAAWELLTSLSPLCLGCDPISYSNGEMEDDPCAYCDCQDECEADYDPYTPPSRVKQ